MIRSITILLLLLSFFNPMQAQNEHKPILYVSAGITFLFEPEVLRHYWNSGPNFGIGLGYQVADDITLRGHLDYQRMTNDADEERADWDNDDEVRYRRDAATIFTVIADLKVNMRPASKSFVPYLVLGVGHLRLSLTDMTATYMYQGQTYTRKVDPKSATVFHMGAGCDFRLTNHVTLFVEGKYSIGYTDAHSTQYFPIKLGISLR
jgi:opacity protein-like surface antigen